MSMKSWGDGGVYLRGKMWWIHFPTGRETIRESSKSKIEKEARKLLRKRLSEVQSRSFSSPALERVTVSELLDDLLADYELNGKTLWWAKLNVDKHLRPFFQYYKAARVGTKQIREYAFQKRSQKLADSTINRHFALLRRAFRLGAKADPPKVSRVPIIEAFDESRNVREGFLERPEFLKLREQLPADLKPIATFAYYTGCRKGEFLKLQWPQVDFQTRMIRLKSGSTKNKEPRTIPLTTEMYESLVALKRERDEMWAWSPWVFSRQGDQIKSMYGAWRAACKRAGVEGSLLHDMRRSGVRNLVRAGVPERVAMKISGHKTRDVFERYNIVSEKDLGGAAALLEKYSEGD